MGALQGRTAVVVGGSRGIGRAVVERLARDGAAVVFSYAQDSRAAADVEATVGAAAHKTGGAARGMPADSAVLAQIRELFAQAGESLGGIDIVVLNAGTSGGGRIEDLDEATYDRVMGINARGTFFALQEAARRVGEGGRIIAVSSVNTVLPVPGNAVYSASKAAVEQFVAVAAKELGGRAITVNSVSPGATDTQMLRGANPPEALPVMAGMAALGRLGQPSDIADVVAFLAGPDARWLTGQNLLASGGLP